MDTLVALPASISAGTTVTYRRTLADFPANGGWTLKLYLAGIGTANVTAAGDGADFVVTLSATVTAALAPGVYQYLERVTKAAEVHDVSRGSVNVAPDLTAATPGSAQSWEEKTLTVVEAKLSGRMGSGIDDYQIGSRLVRYIPIVDLMKMRAELKAQVAAQRNVGRAGRAVLVTFPPTGFDR